VAIRWALASFAHSWELRPALYIDFASFDPIREVIGPFAFFGALRSLLAARAIVAKRLALADSDHVTRVWRQFADRSLESRQLLRNWLDASVTEQNVARFKTDLPALKSLVDQLTEYETAFFNRLALLSPDACAAARQAAEETERNEPDGLET
jgi:hypothetical protein